MDKNLEVIFFQSVGPIKFGMTEQEIRNLFKEKPDSTSTGYLGRLNLRWDNLSIKLNNDVTEEISLESDGYYKAIIDKVDVFDNLYKSNIDKNIGKSFDIHGFEVYLSIGIAFTGYLDSSESKTVTFFDQKLVSSWEDLYKKASSRK